MIGDRWLYAWALGGRLADEGPVFAFAIAGGLAVTGAVLVAADRVVDGRPAAAESHV